MFLKKGGDNGRNIVAMRNKMATFSRIKSVDTNFLSVELKKQQNVASAQALNVCFQREKVSINSRVEKERVREHEFAIENRRE